MKIRDGGMSCPLSDHGWRSTTRVRVRTAYFRRYWDRSRRFDPGPIDRVGRGVRPWRGQAFFTDAACSSPSSAIDTSRISTFRILPVTVMGNSDTNFT
jgi:hypothetical protein